MEKVINKAFYINKVYLLLGIINGTVEWEGFV